MNTEFPFDPTPGYLLVELFKEEEKATQSGLILPATKKHRQDARVVAVGGPLVEITVVEDFREALMEKSTTIKRAAPCSVGDVVLINPYFGRAFDYDDASGETRTVYQFGFADIGGVRRS